MNFFIAPQLAFRPFLDPLPVWNHWLVLLFPLTAAIAVVYKAIRTEDLRQLPWEAAKTAFWIIAGMGAAAVGLLLIVKLFSAGYR